MPAQRQINAHSLTAQLCEVRDTDGTVYAACAVDPGEPVDWPQPIAGFTGWNWEAHYAAVAAEVGLAEAECGAALGDVAAAPGGATAGAASVKPRAKASVKATDTPEVTA